uniref:hypothetical protein n=1 Tax=Halogranum amylolyticum TaxID=660520 RepID=UPI000A99A664|nr:hypothetical protein [Halogranum amylolyticum]
MFGNNDDEVYGCQRTRDLREATQLQTEHKRVTWPASPPSVNRLFPTRESDASSTHDRRRSHHASIEADIGPRTAPWAASPER